MPRGHTCASSRYTVGAWKTLHPEIPEMRDLDALHGVPDQGLKSYASVTTGGSAPVAFFSLNNLQTTILARVASRRTEEFISFQRKNGRR